MAKYKGQKQAPAIGYEMRYIGEVGVVGYDVATDLTKLHIQEAVEPMHEEDIVLPIDAHENPSGAMARRSCPASVSFSS